MMNVFLYFSDKYVTLSIITYVISFNGHVITITNKRNLVGIWCDLKVALCTFNKQCTNQCFHILSWWFYMAHVFKEVRFGFDKILHYFYVFNIDETEQNQGFCWNCMRFLSWFSYSNKRVYLFVIEFYRHSITTEGLGQTLLKRDIPYKTQQIHPILYNLSSSCNNVNYML